MTLANLILTAHERSPLPNEKLKLFIKIKLLDGGELLYSLDEFGIHQCEEGLVFHVEES